MKWLPISYAQFCIEQNATNAGKLFCYLKYHSDGITDKSILKQAGRYFGKSDRTNRRWLNDAMYFNWIGKHEGVLFIRGWQYLFDTLHFQKKACYRFRKSDLKNFKVYCYAAVISYMAKRTQDKELERSKASKHSNGRSQQVPAWVPMSASAIANTLNVPESTARKYRNLAVNQGYFKKKDDVRPFNLNVQQLRQMRKLSDDDPDYTLFIKDGIVLKQYPDKVKVKVQNIHSPKRFFLEQKYSPIEAYSMHHNLSGKLTKK